MGEVLAINQPLDAVMHLEASSVHHPTLCLQSLNVKYCLYQSFSQDICHSVVIRPVIMAGHHQRGPRGLQTSAEMLKKSHVSSPIGQIRLRRGFSFYSYADDTLLSVTQPPPVTCQSPA